MPRVSVVIPTYNQARFLLDAVKSALRQTYRDFEVIVVDDGSTDGTQACLEPYRSKVRVIRGLHRGVSAARNAGIRMAQGEVIAFLDSDDAWFPGKLEIVVPYFDRNPELGMVSSNLTLVDRETGQPLGVKPARLPGRTYAEMLVQGTAAPSSIVLRRRCLEEVGFFDSETDGVEDMDLAFRVAKRFPVLHLEARLGHYRQHYLDTPGRRGRAYRGYIRAFEKALRTAGQDGLAPGVVRAVRRRLAGYRYLLGKNQWDQGDVRGAFGSVRRALAAWGWLGASLAAQGRWRRLSFLAALKPYAELLGLGVAAPLRRSRRP